nr:hypothetical protein [uncultured Flavobacterium sp.]
MAGDRPRIPKENIIDPHQYTENCCSKNARRIVVKPALFNSDVWADKHYNIRVQHGDDNGARDGIEIDVVLELIDNTFNHVINYSLKYGKIVNFPPFAPPKSTRIVLQDLVDAVEDFLNVAVEYHFLDVDTYEITVWTAMTNKAFRIREGQYIIQLHHDKTILHQMVKGTYQQLHSFDRK